MDKKDKQAVSFRVPEDAVSLIDDIASKTNTPRGTVMRYFLLYGIHRQQLHLRYQLIDAKLDVLISDSDLAGDAIIQALEERRSKAGASAELDSLFENTDIDLAIDKETAEQIDNYFTDLSDLTDLIQE